MNFGRVLTDGLRAGLGINAAAFALAAIGLNVQYGFTGLLNFGQVGFLLVGAYGTAITVDGGGPLWVALLVGIGAAVALALILGIPTLRLRTDYLAIVTISAAEILRIGVASRQLESFTGGAFGIGGFAEAFYDLNPYSPGRYGIGDVSFNHRTLWLLTVAWGCVFLASLMVWLLVRSPYGRVLRSIREDEDAARSLGKNAFGTKLQSLILGGVFGALGGMVIAIDASFTNADFWKSPLTFFAYAVLIIGGVASVLGPVVGAMIFWFLFTAMDTLFRQAIIHGVFGDVLTPTDTGPIRIAFVGLALMALMIFRPQGMFGNREEALVDER
ncbi:MAG TPA: branched-chain amino acid ABC transporter permease [Acidimicrobiia bacterium]|nr:branched-chain amino acid ABC transporter permease [Acidimicrobiia bacterium]